MLYLRHKILKFLRFEGLRHGVYARINGRQEILFVDNKLIILH